VAAVLSVAGLKVSPRAMAASVALLLLNLVSGWLLWFTPDVSYTIASSAIRPEIGQAYAAVLDRGTSWAYRMPTDSAATPSASRLQLFEDGHPLGPPHSLHADIREKAGGRFSNWDDALIFAASDGSDPRSNGRIYSITSPTEMRLRLKLLLGAALVLPDLAWVIFFRRSIGLFLRRRTNWLCAGLAGSLVLLAAMAAFGVFGTLFVAKGGPPEDGALALGALQHALLGCLTSVCFWAAGAGVTRLILRDPRIGLPQLLIPAFPLGMLLLAALLAVALLAPAGRPLALALWFACLVPLLRWRPPRAQVVAALQAMLAIVPLAIAFGIWLGLLWHGPTDTLQGSSPGDLTFYAGNIWSLASHPYPHPDLGYAGAEPTGYFNGLYPAFGAALLYLPNFDPFLFLLSGGAASYVLLSASMLHLYAVDRVRRPISALDLLLLVLAVVVAARYPAWVAESIPLVFVPALTISVAWMADRGRHFYGWSVAAMLAGLGGSLLSKVVSAAVLVPLGSVGLWPRFRALPRAVRLAALVIAGVFGVYSAAMLIHFIPIFAATAGIGPESLRTPQWYFFSRDAGAVVMLAVAWMAADWPVALTLSFGLATFFAFSWIFQINFVCVTILLGLIVIEARRASILPRLLALTAFALSLPALILADYGGKSSGIIWIVCVGGAALIAVLAVTGPIAAKPSLTFRTAASTALTTVAVTALGLVGVARGSIIADSAWYLTEAEPLTPELKQVWSAVREQTPGDALIFTDQVDETQHVLGGWNTYAYSGQRQLYLSSYVTSSLRYDKITRDEVMATNAAVLAGTRSPQSVPVRGAYGSFYAVVAAARPVPPNWRSIFRNKRYALYQIVAP
jgi:hypothetical protein